ncbi:protein MATERNALLY EXPRESSED GENE 5-like isoform X2 [Cucurbita maxima]|uniref:Protein MATERNALLY EXPRESSED GENE 5-like isoform X2 n=1 Tax=Cucurbita maxima TaxID=3661 RepID=A0A6J1ILG1_CUCMA|nr:protein MATERNALLY EXPRESSED GENE 5-like isoform X2 [Cucurbita maxima]XP_022977141.1 protein MATERNALLY EXPRESSED GENE 5-like isoform X2 [Cucurbita maxima]
MDMAEIGHERANSLGLRTADCDPISSRESNIIFVDGLPTDCTRREVGHLFRPFIGYEDIRVVHKEPRRRGDKATVLCFVEFSEARYAQAAMEALQVFDVGRDEPREESNSPFPKIKIMFGFRHLLLWIMKMT